MAGGSPAPAPWPCSIWHPRVTWFVELQGNVCCALLYRRPLCPVLCVVSEPGCCCSRGLSLLLGQTRPCNREIRAWRQLRCLFGKLLLFSTPWKRSGERFVRVCVFCSRNNKGVSAVGTWCLLQSRERGGAAGGASRPLSGAGAGRLRFVREEEEGVRPRPLPRE